LILKLLKPPYPTPIKTKCAPPIGCPAPATFKQYLELSSIKEEEHIPSAQEMISLLLAGQDAVLHSARAVFHETEKANDEATADVITQRIKLHEKNAWMLRSLLE
jgi:starvation-inducible DNA-binding protein